ncbi:MAG TPA: leucyl/phenylalanyl-tRNA--protein transferase [Candidatus Binatia bacterium]|nr:leucyl/phenylalanyl-tRNA--protein transferase [Candidatus Binatia bacterium]
MSPREVLPTRYRMPDPRAALPNGLLAAGGDLEPGTVLAAYRAGIFPWPDPGGRLLWWSPDPRAILPLGGFHESRSLRRKRRRGEFRVTADQACRDVMAGCADRPEGTWITPQMHAAYLKLHELGWVHSIEVWAGEHLVGGIYGIAIGGFFAAESMFHRETDASKVALAELVERLARNGFVLLDVQFVTRHLASLGARAITREDYLARLRRAIAIDARF